MFGCIPDLASSCRVTAVDGQYQIGIYTLRPIRYGEEITFDYNSVTEVCTFSLVLFTMIELNAMSDIHHFHCRARKNMKPQFVYAEVKFAGVAI